MIILFQFALLPEFLATDERKLIAFIIVCAILLFGSRMIFRRGGANDSMMTTDFTQTPFRLPEQPDLRPTVDVHPEMQFENLTIRRLFFAKIDAMTGPPDPFEFADELTVEVEQTASGNRSTWEFTVGTPAGFARLLEQKEWESFYSPETFVIRKYELEMVREMVLEHIESVLEDNPSGAKKKDTDLPPIA